MPDTYTFTIVIDDSGDEFSETFNPKDQAEIEVFEEDIKAALEDRDYYVNSVSLIKVETHINK